MHLGCFFPLLLKTSFVVPCSMDLLTTNTLFSSVLKLLYYPFTGDDSDDGGDDVMMTMVTMMVMTLMKMVLISITGNDICQYCLIISCVLGAFLNPLHTLYHRLRD